MCKSLIEALTSNAATPEIELIVKPTDTADFAATGDVFENADTADTVSANCIIKYVNLRLQIAARNASSNAGWYEYALVMFDNQTTDPDPTAGFTDVNTRTLPDLAVSRYRGNTIWNGALKVNDQQAQVVDLKIKLPDKWCKWKRGQYMALIHYYRGTDTSDSTSICSVVWTSQFKCYV